MKQAVIREVALSDTAVLVELSHQLGYSITQAEMLANIELCHNNAHYKIFVAESEHKICGFIGLTVARWLHRNGSWAKILALIVIFIPIYRLLGC